MAECPLLALSRHRPVRRTRPLSGAKQSMTIFGTSAFVVAVGGKADITFCTANVRFDPKRTWAGVSGRGIALTIIPVGGKAICRNPRELPRSDICCLRVTGGRKYPRSPVEYATTVVFFAPRSEMVVD